MSATYHRIIRKLVVGFGSLFDNITLTRYKADGTEDRRIKVPIIYSPKEKYVARLVGDPDLNKKVQITLPRMSFDLLSMTYDSSRKQITNQKIAADSGASNRRTTLYNPVPYNFEFSLYIYVRNIEDGTQIIEHILPFFTPEYTIKLNLVPTMGIVKEVPMTLNSVDYNIEYEGIQDSDARVVIWTLNFTAKAFVYGSTSEGKIIKSANTNILNLDYFDKDGKAIFNINPVGFGKYKIGETVYQGYSFDTAKATATVLSYSNTTNRMVVTDINGVFRTNTEIIGMDSFAEYTLKSFDSANANSMMVNINSYVNPANATSNSAYTIETTITEYHSD
jgi:hypothetical protein